MNKKRITYDCSVEAALGVIGGKWKSVILFYLTKHHTLRFGEFRRLLPKVTQQMLTAQLRELEFDGIIHRKVYAEVPPKVEYSLTEFGKTVAPIIELMAVWGDSFERRIEELAANSGQSALSEHTINNL
jgi:DNA-binding HxlR family transcriptional regulator